jgi:magnesium chelatase subunit H
LELANLKDLLIKYRTSKSKDLRQPIFSTCQRCGIESETPLPLNNQSAFDGSDLASSISSDVFDEWVVSVANYLELLQERLFSSGLRTLGSRPSEEDVQGYLSAFYGDSLSEEDYKLNLKTDALASSQIA